MKIEISQNSKDLLIGFAASLFLHFSVLVGITRSCRGPAVHVTPSYEVSLVHVKIPKKKIRKKPKKKRKKKKIIKKKVEKRVKKIPPPKKKKRAKPVVKDEIKIAVVKKPPPRPTPPPPEEEPQPPPKPVSKITREDGAASQLTVESAEFPYQFYVDMIHRKIMSNWFPESDYVDPDSKVTILVYFRVRRNGDINELKLVSGSGEDIIDKSAISAIVSSKPLPGLPDGFEDDYLGINFQFILYGVQWQNE